MRNFQGVLCVDAETLPVIGAMGPGEGGIETGWFQVPKAWGEKLDGGTARLELRGDEPRTIATRVTSPPTAAVMVHVEFETVPAPAAV